jgi:hypothetical protein
LYNRTYLYSNDIFETELHTYFSEGCFSLKANRRTIDIGSTSGTVGGGNGPGISNCITILDYNQCGVASGSSLASWTDVSGYGFHATQSVASKQPKVGAGGIVFDGVDDTLRIPNIGLDNFTLFVRGKYTTSGSYSLFIEHGPDANSINGFCLYGSTTPFKICRSGSIVSVTTSSNWFGSTTSTAALRYSPATGIQFFRNGVVCKDSASFSVTGTVSASLNICSRNQNGVFCGTEMKQLLIYNTALNDEDMNTVQAWLVSQP